MLALAVSPRYPALSAEYKARGALHVRQQYARVLELSHRVSPTEERRLRNLELAVIVAAETGVWSGKSGTTDELLMRQFLEVARRVRRTRIGYSIGQLMIDGGWTRKATVLAALERLQATGWLRVTAPQTGKRAKTYKLCVPNSLSSEVGRRRRLEGHLPTVPHRVATRLAPAAHDAFAGSISAGHLNKTSARVLHALLTATIPVDNVSDGEELEKKGTVSTQRLVLATGLSPTTVRVHLKALVEQGLVASPTRGSWTAVGRLGLDTVAERQGTAGSGDEVERRVIVERSKQTERMQGGSSKRRRGA